MKMPFFKTGLKTGLLTLLFSISIAQTPLAQADEFIFLEGGGGTARYSADKTNAASGALGLKLNEDWWLNLGVFQTGDVSDELKTQQLSYQGGNISIEGINWISPSFSLQGFVGFSAWQSKLTPLDGDVETGSGGEALFGVGINYYVLGPLYVGVSMIRYSDKLEDIAIIKAGLMF
jgi:hypothetical protein